MSSSFNRILESKGIADNANGKSFLLIFGTFFTVIPLIFICIGAGMVLMQESKMHTFLPVKAHIDSSTVSTQRGSKGGSTYSPDITYEYAVAGQQYTSSQTLVSSLSTSDYNWAQGIADRYHAGQTAQAYYNPVNPGDAFLVKEHSYFPYFFVVFPMIHLTIGLVIILTALGFFGTMEPKALAQPDGWYRISPDISVVNRRTFAALGCVWWYGVGGLVLGHFFLVTENKQDLAGMICTIVYSLLGLVVLVPAIRWSLILREMSDPIVRMKASPVTRGEDSDVELTFKTNTDLRVKDVQVGVLCQQKQVTRTGGSTSMSTNMCYENWQTIPEHRNFHSDQKFKIDAKVSVPPNDTSPPTYFGATVTNKWMIGVKVHVENGTDYFGKFPIDIM